MKENDFKSVMGSLFKFHLFYIPGVSGKVETKTGKALIFELLVTVVFVAVVSILTLLFMEMQASPRGIRPVAGVYAFGDEVQVTMRDGEKLAVCYATAEGARKLRARIGFFPYNEEGFVLSGEYLGMYLTKPYQRNGIAVLQSDTTVKYWAALRSRDRFYDKDVNDKK